MHNFSKQKVIVTGATRGIGKAIATAFLEQNALVFGLYGANNTAAEQFLDERSGKPGRLTLYKCNVADFQAVEALFLELEQAIDTIDILVNNAGIRQDALAALMHKDQWQQVIDVNLSGTFNTCRFAIPLMLKQKYGRIINITSAVSYLGFPGQANYAASKAGQIGLTKTLAKETARKKITVNCVSPGFIATEFINDLSKEQLLEYKKMVPMRRFGTVEEVADTVLFLASKQASYITGSVIDVTGGL